MSQPKTDDLSKPATRSETGSAKRPRFDTSSSMLSPARPRTGAIALSFAVVYRTVTHEETRATAHESTRD